MGHAIGGSGKPTGPSYKTKEKKLTRALVVEDVIIIEKRIDVPVYKLVDVPTKQVKYVTEEKKQTKYKTVEQDTTQFVVKEEDTTKFVVKEEETTRFVPKEIEVERPIIVPKEYEKPIVKEKIVELVSYGDLTAIKELKGVVASLVREVTDVKKQLEGLRAYKLVEEVIKAPKIEWIPTPVERVVWKDVVRERPHAK